MTEHERYMQEAIKQAKLAFSEDEVPVGAVLVKSNEILVRAHNRCVAKNDPTMHAELIALKEGAALLGGRFDGCTLYVTLEPCAMCAGALVNCKLPKIVFGAPDQKAGCCGSVADLTDHWFLHSCEVWGGICSQECAALLSEFFFAKRCKAQKDEV